MTRLGRSHPFSDPGRKRRHNEDAFVCEPPLFAIADGMGGAQAGEIASELAAGALRESGVDGGGGQRVVELIQEANRRVHERASTDPSTSGMGTTITLALVEDDGTVTIGHVGDSRAYVLRGGRLEQLTNDHSLVAELVRRGELSAQEAEVHPQRSVITRALGTEADVDVDVFSVEAKPGDLYLICSDGLSDMLDAGAIEELLRGHRESLERASKALVQAANRAGGDDNITVVLFEMTEGEPGSPDERTREHAAVRAPAQPMPDEEDTLHPEDAIEPPPARAPSAVDTMVVSAAELDAAVREQQGRGPAREPGADREPEPELPEAGLGRRLLALAVIAALLILIVLLIWWGLAR